jgi:dihydroorotate dehydrogenase (NAD+) catalytic subunit
VDRSYAWNYSNGPALPRRRGKLALGPGARLLGYGLNSALGISAGPLINSKWVAAYARLGFDVLTYKTVRTSSQPAYALPNVAFVRNLPDVAVSAPSGRGSDGWTLAVSMGMPSMEPDVWRKDVRRAKEQIGRGQILIVSVVGTPVPGGEVDALASDYARAAGWAADAGADVIEVNLACPNIAAEHPQMIYEDLRVSAHIVARVRGLVSQPVIAKLGAFRTPRTLHETATRLAPWVAGFVLVDGVQRRVVDQEGNPLFGSNGRELAGVVGADTYAGCSRQVAEIVAWRKAGAWDRAILAVGGITSVERAQETLRGGANAALVATAALADPLFAYRFRTAALAAA